VLLQDRVPKSVTRERGEGKVWRLWRCGGYAYSAFGVGEHARLIVYESVCCLIHSKSLTNTQPHRPFPLASLSELLASVLHFIAGSLVAPLIVLTSSAVGSCSRSDLKN
jgi:hypothetical protein